MLTTIRHTLQKSGKNVILWVVLLALMGVFSLPTLLKRETTTPWAIDVNGTIIPYSTYQQYVHDYQEFISQVRSQYGQMADMIMRSMGMPTNPQPLAIQKLVSEAIVDECGQKMGIEVSAEMIEKKLGDVEYVQRHLADIIPAFIYEGGGTVNTRVLNHYLQKKGISMRVFEEMIEKAIARRLVVDLAQEAFYVPSFEVEHAYNAQYADKKISVLALAMEGYRVQAREMEIADGVLEKYYEEQNKAHERYAVAEKRSGTLYTVNVGQYKGAVGSKEVEEYYEKHKMKEFIDTPATVEVRHIVVDATSEGWAKIEEIRNYLVDKREEFARVAQEQLTDAETAKNGGLLKPFSRGEQDQALERASFALQADGEISPIVETKSGYEIVQRVHKRERTYKTLENVRGDIEKKLEGEAFGVAIAQQVKELQGDDGVRSDKLEEFIKNRRAQVKTVNDVDADDTKAYAKTLFTLKEHGVGSYREGDTGVIVVLEKIRRKYTPPLESLKEVVKEDYYEDQAGDLQEKDAIKILEAMETRPMAEIAEEYGVPVKTTGWITPGEKTVTEWKIPDRVIAPLDGKGAGVPYRHKDALLIIAVDDIRLETVNEKQKKELEQKLKQEITAQGLQGFVASLYRNATIKMNQNLMVVDEYAV